MKMSLKAAGISAIAILSLVGCGGGNGGSSSDPSPFAGTYSGTISQQSGGNVTANWTVAATGYINGNDTNGGTVGTDSGFVDKSGLLKVTSKAPGFDSILFQANVSFSVSTGHLIGTGTETASGITQAINFDLTPQ